MCAACVAQGVTYVGGAIGALQVMRIRARVRRTGRDGEPQAAPAPSNEAPSDDGTAGESDRLKVGPPG
jgi:hypothetical protein